MNAAQANLESTRDRLSHAKTQAEIQVQQAAAALTQAQASYATAKSNWDRVQDTGKDPVNPSSVNPLTGKKVDNKLNDAQRQQYYTQFVQAEAALRNAEDAVKQATLAAEGAREAEATGVQASEQQVTQAQAQLNKLLLPPDQNQVASAQAALTAAEAQRAKLNPNPTGSQLEIANAGIAQAEASLASAQLSREKAELKAPFSGVVSIVNIDPGDPSSTNGQPAIQVLDTSKLRVEVQISDIDIAKVQLNQAANVQVDALDQEFQGRVSYIAPQATESGNVRTYLVRVALDQTKGLRPGMSARVDIIPGQFVQPPTPTSAPTQSSAAASDSTAAPACTTAQVKSAVVQDDGTSVTVRALNVRNAPNGAVVASLHAGDQVQRLDDAQEQGGIVWAHVQLASGVDGWVSEDYIEAACS